MVWPAHKFHARGHAPIRKIDVSACLEKMQAHSEHGHASVDKIGDTGIGSYRCVGAGPPVKRCLFFSFWHVCFLLCKYLSAHLPQQGVYDQVRLLVSQRFCLSYSPCEVVGYNKVQTVLLLSIGGA